MGKKKKKEEIKPWCYYCDRQFNDEATLVQHQKAKHFKCPECNKKLNTAQGLSTHCYQVHKLTVTAVPAAKPGRESMEIEIFGMAGVPAGMKPGLVIDEDNGPAVKRAKVEDDVTVPVVSLTGAPVAPPPPAPAFPSMPPASGPPPYGAPMPRPGYGAPPGPYGYPPGPGPYGGPPGPYPPRPMGPPPYGGPPPGPGMPPPGMPQHHYHPRPGMPPLGMPPHPGGPPPGPGMPPPMMGMPPHMMGMPPHGPGHAPPMLMHGAPPGPGPLFPIGPGGPGAPVPPTAPPTALFPIAGSSVDQAGDGRPSGQAAPASGNQDSGVVWTDEEFSIEERRARLPKYAHTTSGQSLAQPGSVGIMA